MANLKMRQKAFIAIMKSVREARLPSPLYLYMGELVDQYAIWVRNPLPTYVPRDNFKPHGWV